MLILLHIVGTGEPVLVNPAHIVTCTPLTGKHGGSEVWFDIDQHNGFSVRENLADIMTAVVLSRQTELD
jgi:hypothetical protein